MINNKLAQWSKDDPPAKKSPTFADEEIEEFLAYCENTPQTLLTKVAILFYISCLGRKNELSEATWEDVKQFQYQGKTIWKIKYPREKQQGRPEEAESYLFDDISNLIFNLYAGTVCFLFYGQWRCLTR